MKISPCISWCAPSALALFLILFAFPLLSYGADSFVEGDLGFDTVDAVVDSDGTTYIVGKSSALGCLIKKYDSNGLLQPWGDTTNIYSLISAFTPAAVHVGGTNGAIYIAGGNQVVRVSKETGIQIGTSFTTVSQASFKDIFVRGNSVFVCGTLSSTATIGGLSAPGRGVQAALIVKLSADLSSSAQALSTYGFGGNNTAESIVLDENGAVYVGGYLSSGGSFAGNFSVGSSSGWTMKVASPGSKTGVQSLVTTLRQGGSLGGGGITLAQINLNISEHTVLEATTQLWVPSDGSFTFSSTTDDGGILIIDGTEIIVDYPGEHGALEKTGTAQLTRGYHTAKYIAFNYGGPGSARLAWSGPGASGDIPGAAGFTGNKGYIFKLDNNLSGFHGSYFTAQEFAGSGGTYSELHYDQGWVYAVGSWVGVANNAEIGNVDTADGNNGDLEVVKLDTQLKFNGRATVKSSTVVAAYGVSSDQEGNVYLTGSFQGGSARFVGTGDRNSADPADDRSFASRASANANIFVAMLDPDFNYKWATIPSDTPPNSFNPPKVRWNHQLQRLFWVGYSGGSEITMGEEATKVKLSGQQGFVSVLDPDGKYTERVELAIISEYGESGRQVRPFGGPAGLTDRNLRKVIKGIQITTSVPRFLYRDILGGDITDDTITDATLIDNKAETRIRSTGYSVDDNVVTGEAQSYAFAITQDTEVKFNWAVEYALTIDRDFSGTVGTGDPLNGISGLPGLQSEAAGNPVPAVKKHWIPKDDGIIATIDRDVLDFSSPGLPVKYLVTGFRAAGPPNTVANGYQFVTNVTQGVTSVVLNTDFIPFTGNEVRQQISEFFMSGPARIVYVWKLKIGVQVDTTGPDSSSLPLIDVVNDPGSTAALQSDGVGVGTFFFDEHTSLVIGTVRTNGVKALQGWFNGDGFIFPQSGTASDLALMTLFRTNGNTRMTNEYRMKEVVNLVRPARVMWNYGDRIFEEVVNIGNYVTFNTVDDPNILALMLTTNPPARVDVSEGPQGSTGDDMAIWDNVGKKLYPLRPGKFLAFWRTTDANPEARVITRIISQFSSVPHYRHIANTPGVKIDPEPADSIVFKELKYTENQAVVGSDNTFATTNSGRTVLLYGQRSSPNSLGGQVETLRVRVVQTRTWSDQLPGIEPAIIGRKITSVFDTADLDTGYLFFEKVRYNALVHNRQEVRGPIIPVNLHPTAGPDEQFVVVWYEKRDKILWPYQATRYAPEWPTTNTGLNHIVISSRFGNESVAADGTDQIVTEETMIGTNLVPAETSFNPTRFFNVQIYHQPDITKPGYNPNEEHALLAPSLRSVAVSPRPMAAYALRDGDLNRTNQTDGTYTSDRYVLVQFFDNLDEEFKMKVYSIIRTKSDLNLGELSYDYKFEVPMLAGEPVIPFYPLDTVIGATPCGGTYGRDGQPTVRRTFWKDHKDTGWAISGEDDAGNDGFFFMYFFYPLTPDFWWPPNTDGSPAKIPGDCVAWLPSIPGFSCDRFFSATHGTLNCANASNYIDYRTNNQVAAAQQVEYTTRWPESIPILKVGETLTFSGGEYRTDNPNTLVSTPDGGVRTVETPGLPGLLAWAAGEIIYDTLNPLNNNTKVFTNYTARLFPALEQRTVGLSVDEFPTALLPVNGRSRLKGGKYVFIELPSSLQKRIFYDPLSAKLGIKGFLNDKDISDPTLTAAPPAVYVLEPNVLTARERDILNGSAADSPFADLSGSAWAAKINQLYDLCRNPNGLTPSGLSNPYLVGVERQIVRLSNGDPASQTNAGIITVARNAARGAPLQALGPGVALVTNPDFADPAKPTQVSYITLAENNHDSLGGSPVVLHIIKVDKRQRYRGAIKTILSDNVFDENIILRHTGDFGGNADALVFEWWYRPEDGTTARTPDRQPSPTPWKLFADPSGNQGRGFYQLTLKGNPSAPEVLLADTLFFVRYRHANDTVVGVNWEVPQQRNPANVHCELDACVPGVPFEWAGAGNSSPKDLDQDGLPDYRAQLAQGWIKRVLDAVNPYEARIRDFTADNPATYTSFIRQLGQKFEGPVALNPDKNVIENVGLIELYETLLKRGRDLSIDLSTPVSTPGIANALQLAATRIADFYTILGNEAYSDALNPTIGYGSEAGDDLSGAYPGFGYLAPSVFSFQNQLSSLLEEELGLLRGVDDFKARPVYNRLFWNFTKAEGEAAYALNYNVRDANNDAFINEADAQILYPQGHGDAWGHYLTAIKQQYDLLKHPNFNWVSRSEFYNLQDVVIAVDYYDERKFAQVAGAKAKAGAEILNLTYRSRFVADPTAQWQGYSDTDTNRAWGVEEWARRAGQGAYFDWVTANALIPATNANPTLSGLQKIDRSTVKDIALIAANLAAIHARFDEANGGLNPLGLLSGALLFDIDPTWTLVGSTAQIGTRAVQGLTHFDQIYERALAALKNAKSVFDYANESQNLLRGVANNEEEFRHDVFDQDLGYRNQLIEIFGMPYEGTIGAGQLYPAGFVGPDTMLFMYVDVREVNASTVPRPTLTFTGDQNTFGSYLEAINDNIDVANLADQSVKFLDIDNDFRRIYAESFQNSKVSDFTQTFGNVNYTSTPFNPTNDANGPRVNLQNMKLPVAASGYTFQAPSTWSRRASPGTLQQQISKMVQKETEIASAIAAWDSLQGGILRKIRIITAQGLMNQSIRNEMKGQIAANTVFNATSLTFKLVSAGFEIAAEALTEAGTGLVEGVPKVTPTAGLAFSAGDALSFLRTAFKVTTGLTVSGLTAQKIVFDKLVDVTEFAKAISEAIFALSKDNHERNFGLMQQLVELENLVGDEAKLRIEVFKAQEELRELSDEYRSMLQQGLRLMQEREVFNKRVAGMVQQKRYKDVSFRVSRNSALEKYRSAFDLAARYVYLTATTYDYDTNLDFDDPGSPVDVLASIVRQRTLGVLSADGQPVAARGGLAEDLAWLKTNFDLLKTRMGLNNPQLESTTFSLRTEAFRILEETNSDPDWRAMLRHASVYKDDLWQVPEFRRHCRPFDSATNGPQPGLVISFSTQITPGKNFFGQLLGGGDNAYDPSVFATKINWLAVWFTGYDNGALTQTPRVYLVPVGQDVMTIPNDPDLAVRLWKVLDQSIPIPLPNISGRLNDPTWKPAIDSLNGTFGETRRFSSFRATGYALDDLTTLEALGQAPEDGLTLDARLVGRSVWNTRWLLIIPSATLLNEGGNPTAGIDTFIDTVTDIKITINSYGFSGN